MLFWICISILGVALANWLFKNDNTSMLGNMIKLVGLILLIPIILVSFIYLDSMTLSNLEAIILGIATTMTVLITQKSPVIRD